MAHTTQIHMIKSWPEGSSTSVWSDAWTHWTGLPATWRQRAKDRAELASANPRDLADMGMSMGHARFEMNKPFWKA